MAIHDAQAPCTETFLVLLNGRSAVRSNAGRLMYVRLRQTLILLSQWLGQQACCRENGNRLVFPDWGDRVIWPGGSQAGSGPAYGHSLALASQ
ncbi:hypothetical protein SRHO_G00280680 [Serrasalmus rhombeus]